MNQIKLSTPWACESDINQALFIHNGNINDTVKYLKVDKLYRYNHLINDVINNKFPIDDLVQLSRLGLCSKAICENSLEATSWNLEKAAAGLLDKWNECFNVQTNDLEIKYQLLLLNCVG